MSKVRINDLARELEVKSRAILDSLTAVGVTEKKTHSSSLEEDEAERVRQHFQRSGRNGAGAAKVESAEPKQKIDWSRVSKPGDVLKAIQQRKDEAAAIAQRPPVPQTPVARPSVPAAPVVASSPVATPAQKPVVGVPSAAAPRPPVTAPPASPAPPQAAAPSQGLAGQPRTNLGAPGVPGQGQNARWGSPTA